MTTIAVNQLVTAAQINQWAPPGMVIQYAGSAAPSGWLLCDGASYLRTDYPDLFTAIGTTYGAADGSHFNVPDCRGRVAVGYAASGGHSDVSALGNNDGVAAANRRPKHQTTSTLSLSTTANWVGAGSNTRTGISDVETYTGSHDNIAMPISLSGAVGTNNANDPVDTPAYIVLSYLIRALDV